MNTLFTLLLASISFSANAKEISVSTVDGATVLVSEEEIRRASSILQNRSFNIKIQNADNSVTVLKPRFLQNTYFKASSAAGICKYFGLPSSKHSAFSKTTKSGSSSSVLRFVNINQNGAIVSYYNSDESNYPHFSSSSHYIVTSLICK